MIFCKKVKQTMKLTLLEVFQVDKISIIVFDEIQASFISNKVFFIEIQFFDKYARKIQF